MNGRKINKNYENPIDNLLIKFNNLVNPLYKKLNFTPNTLTFLSLIVTLMGYYKYYFCNCKVIGYYFDCADGNYARKYNMVSEFGDLFDHVSDIIKFILLILLIVNLKIKSKTKLYSILVILFFAFLNIVHIGCQEKIYNKESKTLKLTKIFCFKKEHIVYTKYFGSGTLYLIISLILIII